MRAPRAVLCLLIPCAMTAVGQGTPTFQCSRGDIYAVVARFVNSTDAYWYQVTFEAKVKLMNKDGLVEERTRTGELRDLRPHSDGPLIFTSPLSPDSGLKIESCAVDFVKGQSISLKDHQTTYPDLDSVLVATDKACLTDYLQAAQLQGLALRKQIAALMEFGCVKRLSKGYAVLVVNTFTVSVSGRKMMVAEAVFAPNARMTLIEHLDLPIENGFIPLGQLKVAPVPMLEDVPAK